MFITVLSLLGDQGHRTIAISVDFTPYILLWLSLSTLEIERFSAEKIQPFNRKAEKKTLT